MIYGRHPVLEALESGKGLEKIYLQDSVAREFSSDLRKLAKLNDVPVQVVPQEKLSRMIKGNHQGVVALTSLVEYQQLENVLPFIYEKGETPLLILLDGVTDVRNFGSIARTAYAAGAHAIVIKEKNAAPINADAIKTSAGALQKLAVCRAKSIATTVEWLKLNGVVTLAADMNGEKFPFEAELKDPVAIVMGSEDTGISRGVAAAVDVVVKLPQVEAFDSYNVAVAAGMLLYEVQRQRH